MAHKARQLTIFRLNRENIASEWGVIKQEEWVRMQRQQLEDRNHNLIYTIKTRFNRERNQDETAIYVSGEKDARQKES